MVRFVACSVRYDVDDPFKTFGQVAKRSNATDCKSVGFGLRRFKSFPAHRAVVGQRKEENRQRKILELVGCDI